MTSSRPTQNHKSIDSKPKPGLLTLPGELRNSIYDLVLPNVLQLVSRFDGHRTSSHKYRAALTHVNKQLRRETLPIYFGQTRFRLSAHCQPHTGKAWLLSNAPHTHLLRNLTINSGRSQFEVTCIVTLRTTEEAGTVSTVVQLPRAGSKAQGIRGKVQGIIDASDDGRLDAKGYARIIDMLIWTARR